MEKSNVFLIFVKCLYSFGAWPGKYGGVHCLKGTRPFISLFITVCLLIPNIIKGCQRYHNKHALIILLNDLLLMIVCCVYTYAFALLYYKRHSLEDQLDILSNFKCFGKPDAVDRFHKMAEILLRFMFWGFAIGIAVLAPVQILNTEVCDMVNSFYQEETMCKIFLPLYVIRGRNAVKSVILNVIICFTTWRVVNIACSTGYFFMFTCSVISFRLELLMKQIAGINFQRNTARSDLVYCIKHYHYIIKLHNITNAFVAPLFVILKYSFIIITVIALISFMMKPGFVTALYGISWIFGVLLPNTVGQSLIDRSSGVPLALYATNWYDADVSTQKTLLIFIILSQKTRKIEMSMFGEMSHENMKDSFSAFYAWVTLLLKVI